MDIKIGDKVRFAGNWDDYPYKLPEINDQLGVVTLITDFYDLPGWLLATIDFDGNPGVMLFCEDLEVVR